MNKINKRISAESKKPLDISLQFFGILLCLLIVGMVIPISGILMVTIGVIILCLMRRGKKKRK